MTQHKEKPLRKNSLYYNFIGLAYKFVERDPEKTMAGNPASFLNRLYRRRLQSIFSSSLAGPISFNGSISNSLADKYKQEDSIIQGRISDFVFGQNEDNQLAQNAYPLTCPDFLPNVSSD